MLSGFCIKSPLLTGTFEPACPLFIFHFHSTAKHFSNSLTGQKEANHGTEPIIPKLWAFTLCHLLPKVGERQLLFCLKFGVPFLNVLFIGTAHNRCALLMCGFIIYFVSSKTKFNIFSNLSKNLLIYLRFPVSLHILQSDEDGYIHHSRSVVSGEGKEVPH